MRIIILIGGCEECSEKEEKSSFSPLPTGFCPSFSELQSCVSIFCCTISNLLNQSISLALSPCNEEVKDEDSMGERNCTATMYNSCGRLG